MACRGQGVAKMTAAPASSPSRTSELGTELGTSCQQARESGRCGQEGHLCSGLQGCVPHTVYLGDRPSMP